MWAVGMFCSLQWHVTVSATLLVDGSYVAQSYCEVPVQAVLALHHQRAQLSHLHNLQMSAVTGGSLFRPAESLHTYQLNTCL